MTGRRTLISILVLLAMLAGAVALLSGPGASAQTGEGEEAQAQSEQPAPEEAEADPPQATLELTIWQGVELPLVFWISSRADEDDEWSRAEVEMALQEGGGWRVGDLTVTAGEHDFELRLWHDPAETDEDADEVWLSARLAGELWSDYGTQQVELDQVTESGTWNYANLSLTLPLRSPTEPNEDPDYVPVGVCPPEDQTNTYAYVYIWQLKSSPDKFWITSRTASNQKWKTVKLSLSLNEDETWNTSDLTIAGRRGPLDLRLWQDADDQRNVWLSARSAGAGWDDYGTQRWQLDRTSKSGRYWYRLQTVTVAVPDNEAAEPGASTPNWASWDCNNAPTANAGEDQTVNAGSTVTLDGTASSDPDGDALTYLWTGPDDIELTNADTDTATFTTTTEQIGQTLAFTLTVTDPGGKSGADEVEITVQQAAPFFFGGAPIGGGGGGSPGGQAPDANAGADQSKASGTVTLDGSLSDDPDGHSLTYAWAKTGGTCTESVSLTGANTASPSFTMPTACASASTLIFTLTVTDAYNGSDTDTVTIAKNNKPVANAGTDQSVGPDATVVWLNGSASSDADDMLDNSHFSWAKTGGSYTGAISISKSTSIGYAKFTPPTDAAAKATIIITLTVSDGKPGGKSTDTVTITMPAHLTASNVTATGATLTISGHSGNWYYNANTGPDKTCQGPVNTTSKTLTGLTEGTSYVYRAYDASTCTSAIAKAPAFTTGVSLSTSSITARGATLTIAGHTAQWWYKANTGPDSTCKGPVAANTATKTLTGLTPGASYSYSAYAASGCSTSIATAPQFTTRAELTASNITATTATLTLSGWSGRWYYSPGTSACTEVPSGTYTLNLTLLDHDTDYSYRATSAADCAPSTQIAAPATFRTPRPALTSSGVTKYSATLSLSNWVSADGKWWYNSETSGQTTCTEVAAGTFSVSVTGLTPNTAYKYTAWQSDDCLTRKVSTAQSFTTVANVDPTVSLANRNVTNGTSYTLSATGNDPDGANSKLAYGSWDVDNGNNNTGTTDATITQAGLVAIPEDAAKNDTYTVRVTVTDEDGGTNSGTATLTVNNRRPTVNASADSCKQPGQLTGATITGGKPDPDGDSPTYSWARTGGTYTGSNFTLRQDKGAAVSYYMPSDASDGQTIELTVTANDGKGGTDTATVATQAKLSCPTGPNNPSQNVPAVITFNNAHLYQPAGGPQADGKWIGTKVRADATVTDLTGWYHTYSFSVAPGTLTDLSKITPAVDGTNIYFHWPTVSIVGDTVYVELTVLDVGSPTHLVEKSILISRSNAAPTANAGADKYVLTTRDSSYIRTFTGSGSDVDSGQTLYYNWSKTGGSYTGDVTLENATTKAVTVHVPTCTGSNAFASGDTIILRLAVSDDNSPTIGETFDYVTLTASEFYGGGTDGSEGNEAPRLADYSHSAAKGTDLNLRGEQLVSDDVTTDANMTYEWAISASSSVLTLKNENTQNAILEVSADAVVGTHSGALTLRVMDESCAATEKKYDVQVTN